MISRYCLAVKFRCSTTVAVVVIVVVSVIVDIDVVVHVFVVVTVFVTVSVTGGIVIGATVYIPSKIPIIKPITNNTVGITSLVILALASQYSNMKIGSNYIKRF